MATVKQIDANRRNSRLSTGPVTPEGKQRAAANALKSGIYAESELLFSESREALETLKSEHYDRFQPTTPEARDLVDSLIRNAWLLRRLAAAEAALFNCDCNDCTERWADASPTQSLAEHMAAAFNRLDQIQRRINATERNYHRSLKALQTLEPRPQDPQAVLRESSAAGDPLGQLRDESETSQSKTTSEKLASFPTTSPNPQIPASDPSLASNPQASYPKPLEQPPL